MERRTLRAVAVTFGMLPAYVIDMGTPELLDRQTHRSAVGCVLLVAP